MMPTKDPSESVVVEFDFEGELTSIVSAVVTNTVHDGSDASPSSMLYGTPQIDGTKVLHRVQGGVSGVTYKLRCVATSGMDVIVRSALLPVKTAVQTS